jgi:hypothetical protein
MQNGLAVECRCCPSVIPNYDVGGLGVQACPSKKICKISSQQKNAEHSGAHVIPGTAGSLK